MIAVSITTMGRDTIRQTIKKGAESILQTYGRPIKFNMVNESLSITITTKNSFLKGDIKEATFYSELKTDNGVSVDFSQINGKTFEYPEGAWVKIEVVDRSMSPAFDSSHQVEDIEGIYDDEKHGDKILAVTYHSDEGVYVPKAEGDVLNTLNKYSDYELNKVPLENGAIAIYLGGLTFDVSPVRVRRQNISFGSLLTQVIERNCSDLHLQVGAKPTFREIGELSFLEEFEELSYPAVMDIIAQLIDKQQMKRFEEDRVLNFAREFPGVGRARANIFFQRGSPAMAMRFIPKKIPSFEQLHLPEEVEMMTDKHKGLVLVTGATGSGKTTTLATMVNHINQRKNLRIITIEDPIEFRYENLKSVVCQREVGMDCKNFHDALHECTRQNPDIMLIGEIRDHETAEVAMRAAETGHLVFGTLHSTNAVKTLERLTGLLKEGGSEEKECHGRMSEALAGVISQELVPNKTGTGRVPLIEVLNCEKWINEYIRENDSIAIASSVDSRTDGMRSYRYSLWRMIKDNIIDEKIGEERIDNWRPFKQTLSFREYPYSAIAGRTK